MTDTAPRADRVDADQTDQSHSPVAWLLRAAHGIRWYVRELSGEGKWYTYVEECRRRGEEPMSRRRFERHRADHRETGTQSRCC